MNDDEIERRLQDLGTATRPPDGFAKAVMDRIERAAPPRPVPAIRITSRPAIWAAAAIVSLATSTAVLIAWHVHRPTSPPNQGVVVQTFTESLPTLADYRRAYLKSPEALDALLRERPAAGVADPPVRAADLSRPELNLYE
jgi:hypothetical protein